MRAALYQILFTICVTAHAENSAQRFRDSPLESWGLSVAARGFANRRGCRTPGQVRTRGLEELIYNFEGRPNADELRAEFAALPAPLGAEVITADERKFASAIESARIGPRAIQLLHTSGVRTLKDLRRMPLAQMASRGVLWSRLVRQIESVLRVNCAAALTWNQKRPAARTDAGLAR